MHKLFPDSNVEFSYNLKLQLNIIIELKSKLNKTFLCIKNLEKKDIFIFL
jgi:hypothetical protein